MEHKFIAKFAEEDFSLLSLKIFNSIQLYVIYLSQTNNDTKKRLWKKIIEFRDENLHLMIVGDFNIDTENFDVFTQHLINFDLVQLVKEPTHIEGRTIDHLWVSKNLPKIELSYQYPYYTQHKSLLVKFS